jgi:hypothetical protein
MVRDKSTVVRENFAHSIREVRVTRKSIITAALMLTFITSSAQAQYTEQDFILQSKFCENATRLPWGDVDNHSYTDCMLRQGRLRSKEERRADNTIPNTPWRRALDKSLLWAAEDGCGAWAQGQFYNNPPDRNEPDLWMGNYAWNLCMQREGTFSPPTTPGPKPPDLRAMAAEQRTTTILDPTPNKPGQFQYFGCHTKERYIEIGRATGGVLFLFRKEEDIPKLQKLISGSVDCRFWKVGTRVQIKAVDKEMLCLSASGSTDRCYWTLQYAINMWE